MSSDIFESQCQTFTNLGSNARLRNRDLPLLVFLLNFAKAF